MANTVIRPPEIEITPNALPVDPSIPASVAGSGPWEFLTHYQRRFVLVPAVLRKDITITDYGMLCNIPWNLYPVSDNADTFDPPTGGGSDTTETPTDPPVDPPVETTYTITFEYNGADGGNTTASGTTDTSGKLSSLPTPTKSGNTFDGWYKESSFTTLVDTNTVFTANGTIYAKWTAV